MSFLTFQDYENAQNKETFIRNLIAEHKKTEIYTTAVEADKYDRQKNTAIMGFVQKLFTRNGGTITDPTSTFAPIPSNYFRRLNVQRNMYSLGNGILFDDTKIKDKLGADIDTKMQEGGYYALIHGVSFVMWNMDSAKVFPVTEFAPMWDEFTGELRAGVRFWQISADKPIIAVLYEESGYTELRGDTVNTLCFSGEQQPYKIKVRTSKAMGEAVTGGENYNKLPIVPFWGSKLHQSTLVGMKPAIDAYDLIKSGFADNVSQCAQMYWIIDNCGGMTETDFNKFREDLLFRRVATVDADNGVRITPYAQEIPHNASTAALAELRKSIFEDFGGLDVSSISSSAKTATEINAAYQPLDENADDYEFEIITTISALLALQGVEAEAKFKRNRIANQNEQTTMEGCVSAVSAAEFPYVSCNFHYEKDGESTGNVLESYVLVETGGKQIAFIGITTPETITSTTPAYFQDKDGNYIYGIAGGADGAALYSAVQKAVDEAREDGADYIIALGHLGVDASSSPWASREVIANTAGLDAFIDGHSHTTIEMEKVADKAGETVVLTQTGSYLDAVGKMTITADGTIITQLLTGEDLAEIEPDRQVKAIENAWVYEINARLGEVIGYAQITLDNYDAEGRRLVRTQETNSGDFSADALYYLFDSMDIDVDVAVMNGGGIRNGAVTGELSYLACKEIHTFGNVACLLTVSGQQLLDALEWGARAVEADGTVEEGSFLHVAGICYTVDTSIPSTVQQDDKGVWTGGPAGEYRVKDVQVLSREAGEYEPLELSAEYNLAGYNYTLRDLGGGFAMFEGAVNVLDYVAEDYMVLANYIKSFPVDPVTGLPTIAPNSGYDDVCGDGRITILGLTDKGKEPEHEMGNEAVYVVQPGDSLWKISGKYYGSGDKWHVIYAANKDTVDDPNLIWVGQVLTIPECY